MNHECSFQKEHLVSTSNSAITQCGCGIYHVYIGPITLHLTPPQFEATARLFKLALGMAAARRLETNAAPPADKTGSYTREEILIYGR